ncbi:MAG: hypothetical protein ABIK15_19805 [Pseudomonadota bacterium]
MKNLKENLQAISKELKTLMGKVEKLGKALDKAAKSAIASKMTKKKAAPKAAAKKSPAKKKTASKKPAKKAAAAAEGPTAIDTVVDIIKKSKNGVDVDTLIKKTGYDAKKISNLVYKAKKRGDIKSGAKGVYVKK